MSQQFQQISAMGSCFPALALHFRWQIRPRKFHSVHALGRFILKMVPFCEGSHLHAAQHASTSPLQILLTFGSLFATDRK
jgi:hypothetical protein